MPGVTEIATFFIQPGLEPDFLEGFHVAKAQLEASQGFRSLRLVRGIESSSTFVLFVDWDSVEAHMAFRETERLAAWRAPITRFYAEPPTMAHYVDV